MLDTNLLMVMLGCYCSIAPSKLQLLLLQHCWKQAPGTVIAALLPASSRHCSCSVAPSKLQALLLQRCSQQAAGAVIAALFPASCRCCYCSVAPSKLQIEATLPHRSHSLHLFQAWIPLRCTWAMSCWPGVSPSALRFPTHMPLSWPWTCGAWRSGCWWPPTSITRGSSSPSDAALLPLLPPLIPKLHGARSRKAVSSEPVLSARTISCKNILNLLENWICALAGLGFVLLLFFGRGCWVCCLFVVGLVCLVNFSEGIYCQVTQWDLQKRTHCSWLHSQEQIGRKHFLSVVAQLMRGIFTKLEG